MFGFTSGQAALGLFGGGVTAAIATVAFGFTAAFIAWIVIGATVYAVDAFSKHAH